MPMLGQDWPAGQHTVSTLAEGAVNEGLRKLLHVSQQITFVGSVPGHTGHTAESESSSSRRRRIVCGRTGQTNFVWQVNGAGSLEVTPYLSFNIYACMWWSTCTAIGTVMEITAS
jgi:hypothetical protein